MNSSYDVDLFVIGGGSGGVRTARIAAAHGAKVAIAEEDRWGGTCVIRGCIPKKLFVYASELTEELEVARSFGWNIAKPTFDWSRLLASKDKEIARLSGLYLANLERHGVTIHPHRARLVDANTVLVGDRRISCRYILIATGGRPFFPTIPGAELAITSNEAFHLETFPKRVAVVGGGYIGVEFAHIFAGLGSKVTLVHRRDRVLRGFDEDIRRCVTENIQHAGIDYRFGTTVEKIEKADRGELSLTLSDNSTLVVDQMLCAMGRVPNTSDLGLDAAGIVTDDKGAIPVDDHSRTNVENIFAVGDCTPRIQLTPVAIRDGHAVADMLFGDSTRAIDHDMIPTAVFSQPPAATVGMTDEQAHEAGIRIEVFSTDFRPLRLTLGDSKERVMIKILVDKEMGQVIGAHMVGRDAAEIIQTLAIAIKRGVTMEDLRRTVALHPTTAEELVLL